MSSTVTKVFFLKKLGVKSFSRGDLDFVVDYLVSKDGLVLRKACNNLCFPAFLKKA